MGILTLILIILAAAAFWLVKTYNRLQTSMQNIREMYSNLQAGLKKRQQLSGQIIEIASGYMAHEQLTQLKVAQNNPGQMQVLAQAFPELKADATYQKLMQQLENLENDILARRENYNNRVNAYNSYRNSFPVVLVAQKLSFDIIQYFDTDDEKFDLQAQSFSRDDTQALQQFIGESTKAAAGTVSHAVKQINQGVSQLKDKIDGKPVQETDGASPPENQQPDSPQSEQPQPDSTDAGGSRDTQENK
ncbi:LemA family [Kingella potus]|uniref:LemA family n=1 Tax=Kingella potus TaxID=265175 RepID=A0A377R426_9NEIS|nr:LemA family protein [Kingella potus]UOP00222.1 LemA family protein [Kingella potus]STR02722.1 LemA family [Kingella potus]